LNYDTTEITIRILRSQDPDPTPSTYLQRDEPSLQRPSENGQRPSAKYGSRTTGATRQSTRIRQVKDKGGRRKLTIFKQSTVKDMKMMVSQILRAQTPREIDFFLSYKTTLVSRLSISVCFTEDSSSRTIQ